MRSSILLGVLVSSSVHVSRAALSRRQLPACATNCFLTTTNRGGCNIADTACLCESQVYISSTYACFEAACSTQDLATAVSASIQECAAVGITLSSAVKSATSAALSSLASQTATGASPSRSPSSASATYPAGSSTSSRSSSDSSATNTSVHIIFM
ncbi:hypothetical protein B0H10DRAFT_653786 [Mycena sp. CBHHK59/15]|nr:hypothetical protein B0H10DRAFT_653786 [Mycena sp. CBHHK59/15]